MKISQDWGIGTYNFCDSKEKSFYGKIFITEDDGKRIVVGDNSPVIEYSVKEEDSKYGLDDEKEDFLQLFNGFDIQELFDKSYKYISGMWSTKDYTGNMLLFEKMFTENYDELYKNFAISRNKEIQKEIDRLQGEIVDQEATTEAPNLRGKEREKAKIEKSVAYYENELGQYKEGTDKYLETEKRLQDYKNKLNNL